MGEGADFFDEEGVTDPAVVRALKDVAPPVDDRPLLARFINHFAGDDLRFGHVGLTKRINKIRPEVVALLREMQPLAQRLRKLDTEKYIEPLELAIASSLPRSVRASNPRLASRAVDAVDLIATLPLADGAARGRPESDPVATNIVRAVRAYCDRKGIPFTGEPRAPSEADDGKVEVRSQAATLAGEVLRVLGLDVTPTQLGTLFRKVRES